MFDLIKNSKTIFHVFFVFSLFGLFHAPNLQAAELNSICKNANIALVMKSAESKNFCEIPDSELSSELRNFLMGVPLDWNNDPINEAVYLHELGHVIVGLSGDKLPQSFKYLKNTSLFIETIADLISTSIKHTIISPEPSLPACFLNFRTINDKTSYYLPEIFFTSESTRVILSCCQERLLANDSKFEALTKECAGLDAENRLAEINHRNVQKLSPNSAYDNHMIGLPIQAFLKSLSSELKMPLKNLILTFLNQSVRKEDFEEVDCQIIQENERREYTSKSLSMELLFASFKDSLSKDNQKVFDNLWNKYGMDMVNQISDKDSISYAMQRYMVFGKAKRSCSLKN